MNTKANSPIDPSICPLCGKPNLCPMAADPNANECWCSAEKFPRQLLVQIPEVAVRRACICANCLERFQSGKELTD